MSQSLPDDGKKLDKNVYLDDILVTPDYPELVFSLSVIYHILMI